MHTIDVHDLPEPVARAVAETVQALREQFSKNGNQTAPRLPAWPLGSTGTLGRDEIYDDHLDQKVNPRHP